MRETAINNDILQGVVVSDVPGLSVWLLVFHVIDLLRSSAKVEFDLAYQCSKVAIVLVKVLPFAIRRDFEGRSNIRECGALQQKMVGALSSHIAAHLGIFEIRNRVVDALVGGVTVGMAIATFSNLAVVDLSASEVEMV